jgi:hypothetical protein
MIPDLRFYKFHSSFIIHHSSFSIQHFHLPISCPQPIGMYSASKTMEFPEISEVHSLPIVEKPRISLVRPEGSISPAEKGGLY